MIEPTAVSMAYRRVGHDLLTGDRSQAFPDPCPWVLAGRAFGELVFSVMQRQGYERSWKAPLRHPEVGLLT